jgi:cellulose synthase/poly-beta-1,6-N-acetylglucosamine synthase-like glycosyltransferase
MSDDMYLSLGYQALWWTSAAVIAIGFAQAFFYAIQLITATWAFLKRPPEMKSNKLWHRYASNCPPISLIVPAYNESLTIVESVNALLALQYPCYEIIVVNDGSKDDTLDLLRDHFHLSPSDRFYESRLPHKPIRGIYARPGTRLTVIDKANGGKADAQNAGVNISNSPIVCVIDGDSILEADALLRASQPFIDDPEHTIAVGGSIRIANGVTFKRGRVADVRLPATAVLMFQIIEYFRAFLIARLAWSSVNTLMLISGAFSVFRRAELLDAGGFTPGSLGEDLDVVVKLHRMMRRRKQKYRIVFIADPVCWTEAPGDLKILARQRMRWQKGALEVFWRYKEMLLNPRYGRIGMLGYSQLLIFDVLGPVAEALGFILIPLFWYLGVLSGGMFLGFTGLYFAFGIFVSVMSVMLAEMESHRFPTSRDLLKLTAYAILENFGYRQLNTFWRIRALIQYLRADRAWGEMPRAGFSTGS